MTFPVMGGGFNASAPVFPVQRSVRLRSSAPAYFNRTPASAGSLTTWTWSGWVKRGLLSSSSTYALFSGGAAGTITTNWIGFVNDSLAFSIADGTYFLASTAVYRDPSAWYHITAVYDSTNATLSNRIKLYVNGVQITSFSTSTYPTQNYAGYINGANSNFIGLRAAYGDRFFDGYLTEINFIDGQALTPTSFGSYNIGTGVWQPIKYSGTYGANGFYLNFQDNSNNTATTIGKDSSGNNNNWTPNGIVVSPTTSVSYDSMLDVPTNTSNTNANFAVMNPLNSGTNLSPQQANLFALMQSSASGLNQSIKGTMYVSSGKWYWEGTSYNTIAGYGQQIGIASESFTALNTFNGSAGQTYGYEKSATANNGPTATAYGATYTSNDVIGVALNLDAGSLVFYKNGVSQGTAFTGISGSFTPFCGLTYNGGGPGFYMNFGQRPFSYPLAGFNPLCTYNLTTPLIPNGAAYFAATTYTGNGTSQSVINTTSNPLVAPYSNNPNAIPLQPDLVWGKNRSTATSNVFVDSVRGATIFLQSNSTAAEATNAQVVSAFTSTGFSVGNDATLNGSTNLEVAWQWKAGGTAVTNTAGSISSQVSANTTAGFSIVTYTGTGANATVGHGLNGTPKMIFIKNRDNAAIGGAVYHASLGATKYLQLFQTTTGTAGETTDNTAWNGGSPTFNGSVFSVGTLNRTNSAQQMVAYCWSEIPGFSKFDSYTGNGATDGPFVYTGFRPRWVLLKKTTAASSENWYVYDTTRSTYNVMGEYLYPNATGAGATFTTLDITSNGFKIRTTNSAFNTSSGTYIYACFAENPFNYSLAR